MFVPKALKRDRIHECATQLDDYEDADGFAPPDSD